MKASVPTTGEKKCATCGHCYDKSAENCPDCPAPKKYHTYLCKCGIMYDTPYMMQFSSKCPTCGQTAMVAKRIYWDEYIEDDKLGAWITEAEENAPGGFAHAIENV